MNIIVKDYIKEALKNNKPVVALESTIITHGMPYPINIETAYKCEEEIIKCGAIPATIGFVDGNCVVGLSHEEIKYIATQLPCIKVSTRDIPVVSAKKLCGGTTVAATMHIAALVGIKVFATGGIGGVHRKAEVTMDISADLEELALSNVCVVCAGAKAILDLGLTLEYLETKAVPVLGFKTEFLPAFYSAYSPYKVNYRVEDEKEIATIMKEKFEYKLPGGILVCNPIDNEHSFDYDEVNKVILVALSEMEAQNIHGKEVTPFLLGRIKDLTDGASLDSNIELVLNNCRLAADIAKEYCNND